MLTRSLYPRQKNVLVITDFPFKNELIEGEKFSSIANMSLGTALRTGKANNYSGITPEGYKGIRATDIAYTYLDYAENTDPNYTTEIVKGKNRLDDITYHQLEIAKDVWVSDRLWKQFQGLLSEIDAIQPKLIIVVAKWSLFFLTGCSTLAQNQGNLKDRKPLGALNTFRASILEPYPEYGIKDTVVLPILHTVHAVTMSDKLYIINLDLQKAGWVYNVIMEKGVKYFTQPNRNIILGTEKDLVVNYFTKLLEELNKDVVEITLDIETKFSAIIDCIGYCYDDLEAICVPFSTMDNPNYWGLQDEIDIMLLIREVNQHPNARFVGQNLSYEAQFFHHLWGLYLVMSEDTMTKHHVLYNYLPKRLDFLASLYCSHYTYWKNMQVHK
jgi:hypothetical protein